MIEPALVARVSEAVAEGLQPELRELEQRNDDLHRRLRELLAEHGGEYLAELQEEYDELIDLADQALRDRDELRTYALALEAQLKDAKQSPRVERPATIGEIDGSQG